MFKSKTHSFYSAQQPDNLERKQKKENFVQHRETTKHLWKQRKGLSLSLNSNCCWFVTKFATEAGSTQTFHDKVGKSELMPSAYNLMSFLPPTPTMGPCLGHYGSICVVFRSYVEASSALCWNAHTEQLQCTTWFGCLTLILCPFKSPPTTSSSNHWNIYNFSATLLAYCFDMPSHSSCLCTWQFFRTSRITCFQVVLLSELPSSSSRCPFSAQMSLFSRAWHCAPLLPIPSHQEMHTVWRAVSEEQSRASWKLMGKN